MTIEILGIELHARHGVLDEERRHGQRFLVDVWLEPSSIASAQTDAIEDAVDYREVITLVREISGATAYNLLEAFSTAIADALFDRLDVASVRVRVRKPDVRLELPVEHAAVVVERPVSAA